MSLNFSHDVTHRCCIRRSLNALTSHHTPNSAHVGHLSSASHSLNGFVISNASFDAVAATLESFHGQHGGDGALGTNPLSNTAQDAPGPRREYCECPCQCGLCEPGALNKKGREFRFTQDLLVLASHDHFVKTKKFHGADPMHGARCNVLADRKSVCGQEPA